MYGKTVATFVQGLEFGRENGIVGTIRKIKLLNDNKAVQIVSQSKDEGIITQCDSVHQVITWANTQNIAVNTLIRKDYVRNVSDHRIIHWGCTCSQSFAQCSQTKKYTAQFIID